MIDLHPDSESFEKAVLDGLTRPRKRLSPKFLYDQRGSELFDRICDVREYYVTRTETAILEQSAPEIARAVGPGASVFEFGSGASRKTRILLRGLDQVACYVPIDISREFLADSARALQGEFPGLSIVPVCADFTRPLPEIAAPEGPRGEGSGRRVAFFPGSTIGNFDPSEAGAFLHRTAGFVGPGGQLLIGVDLIKDRSILEPAYDDSEGVTAAFNLNLLHRMRRELGASVDPGRFRHRAVFNEAEGRVEMHLEALDDHSFEVAGRRIQFRRGETVHTECSYKYSPAQFEDLARRSGFSVRRRWSDPREFFAIYLLQAVQIADLPAPDLAA